MRSYKLSIQKFRCFESSSISFTNGLTWLVGENASGKTAVLEAIYLLARGRSFRSNNRKELIQRNESMSVCRLLIKESTKEQSLACQLTYANTAYRANRAPIKRSSDLGKVLPLQFIGPQIHTLVSGEPSIRRSFLDWGLFHVEPNYFDAWKSYSKAMKQRNAGLHKRVSEQVLDSLDYQLVEKANELCRLRLEQTRKLEPAVNEALGKVTAFSNVKLNYKQGWSKDKTLDEALKSNRRSDRERGFTSVGPHRADFTIEQEEGQTKRFGSRGQQKLVAISLVLGQFKLVGQGKGLLLIDDLQAELDSKHCDALLAYLDSLKIDAVITSTALPSKEKPQAENVFHVKDGTLH